MSAQTDPQDRAALINLADLVELARRDLLRTSTDFLGRMAQCLSVYEGICEQPDDEWSDATRADAEEELTGLIGLALAQLALVRSPDNALEALQSPSIAEQGKRVLGSVVKTDAARTFCSRCHDWNSGPCDLPDCALVDTPPIAEQAGDEAAAVALLAGFVDDDLGHTIITVGDGRARSVPNFAVRAVQSLAFRPTPAPSISRRRAMVQQIMIEPEQAPSTDALREALERLTHENGPVIIDWWGGELAWRPLDHGTWAALSPTKDRESTPIDHPPTTKMPEAWKRYEADFNGMTDQEIADETERGRREVEEHEDWLEAVASWEAAGKPRKGSGDGAD